MVTCIYASTLRILQVAIVSQYIVSFIISTNSIVFSWYSIDRYLSLPLDDGVEEGNLDKKTLKQIRLGELLHEHSANAKLIVM